MDTTALPYLAYAAILRAGSCVPARACRAMGALIALLALVAVAVGPVVLAALARAALPALAALGDAAGHVVSLARAG